MTVMQVIILVREAIYELVFMLEEEWIRPVYYFFFKEAGGDYTWFLLLLLLLCFLLLLLGDEG